MHQVRTVRDLGAAVRQARTEHHLTQAELAKRVGVSRDWVVRLERGHPRLEMQRVLDALEAVGVALTVDDADDTSGSEDWDDVFADLAERPDRHDG
ncbi:MAG TPA: helix-turn-helix domain-containing protein [Kribbellaceae bacterium]|nr:helix-turn-helix domain-containing protein [Kribbellaceae bacterium]